MLQHLGWARVQNFFFPPASPETPIVDWKSILCSEDAIAREMFRKKTGKYLHQIKAMVEASGARFGVFLIHYMWTFDNEPFYEPRFPTYKHEMKECYASHGRPYNEFIEDYLHQSGMTFQNPLEALLRAKAEKPKRKLWNFVDYHYSPAGHQVNAEEMLHAAEKAALSGPSAVAVAASQIAPLRGVDPRPPPARAPRVRDPTAGIAIGDLRVVLAKNRRGARGLRRLGSVHAPDAQPVRRAHFTIEQEDRFHRFDAGDEFGVESGLLDPVGPVVAVEQDDVEGCRSASRDPSRRPGAPPRVLPEGTCDRAHQGTCG